MAVYKHTHCDDNVGQRHALQGDAGGIHIDECAEDGKYESASYQHAVLEAYEEKQYGYYGYDRNDKVHHKTVVGYRRFVALVVNRFNAESRRHAAAYVVNAFFDGL